jgi:hypothetical protein
MDSIPAPESSGDMSEREMRDLTDQARDEVVSNSGTLIEGRFLGDYRQWERAAIPAVRWYHYVLGAVAGIVALVVWFLVIWIVVFGAWPLVGWLQ